MTCRRNTSRIAARAGPGSSTPIRGSTLSGRRSPAPAARSAAAAASSARRRCRRPPPAPAAGRSASRRGVVQQHLAVAAVGAADQQHHVRSRRPQRGDAGAVERPGRHVHDPGARRTAPTRCPASARDQRLVADDGQPQPAAGRRADVQRRRRRRAAATAASRPCSTSVSDGGADLGPGRPAAPASRSTRQALVYVDPTSTQTAIVTAVTPAARRRCRSRSPRRSAGPAPPPRSRRSPRHTTAQRELDGAADGCRSGSPSP